MYPILLHIGPLPIHTYGFLIAIGFLVALNIIKRLSLRSKLDVEKMLDLAFWCLFLGFLGSRILFVITRFSYFIENPLEVFKVWEGGLVFLGGPIVVVPFATWYLKNRRIPIWKALDVLVPGLVIAHMFGRFGCLSSGCCYGKPTGSSFGIKLYSDLVEKQLQGIPLHPTQLYEAGALFILFFSLQGIFKHKVFDGQVILSYFLAYPIIRSVIEIYRGDTIRGFVIQDILSTSQFISAIIFLLALGFLLVRLKEVQAMSTRFESSKTSSSKKRGKLK